MTITEQILEYVKVNGPCDKFEILENVDVKETTLKPLLFRLVSDGNLIRDGNLYTFIKERVRPALEAKVTKNEYYKELLDVLLDEMSRVEDVAIKVQLIREGKQIIRDLR